MTDERPEAGRRPRWEPAPELLGGAGPGEDPTVVGDPTVAQPLVELPGPFGPDGPPSIDESAPPHQYVPAPSPPPPPPPTPEPAGFDSAVHVPAQDPVPPAGDGDAAGTSSRNRRLAIAAVVLAFVAVVVVTVVLTTRGGDGEPAATTTTSTVATTSTTTIRGDIELVPGVRAIIPEGALTPGASLAAELVDLPDDLGALVAAGPVIDLRVDDGSLRAPVDLVFALSGPATSPPGGSPVVVGVKSRDATTTFPSGTLDTVQGTFVVPVDSPGIIGPATWNWNDLAELARTTFRDLADGDATSAADASCADDLDPGEVTVTSRGDGIAWCAEVDSDGESRRVVAVNRAAFPITIRWSGAVDAARDAGTGTYSELGAGFEGWNDESSLTLAPGERATFRVAAGDAATLTSEVDDTAEAATALLGDAAFVAALHEVIPGADGTGSVQGVVDRIDATCASGTEGGAGALLAACFGEDALRAIVGGPAAALAAPLTRADVLGTVVDDAADAVASTLDRRSAGSVDLAAVEQVSWPVDEQSASPALLVWLDDAGWVHDWARCVDGYCVAGLGDRVAVVQEVDGAVVQAAEVDAAADDPYLALVAIGVPEVAAESLVDRS